MNLEVKEGWLWKKSPKGLKGFHPWQKRWVAVDSKRLTYALKKSDKEVLGSVILRDIAACEHFEKKRVGDRFDIRLRRSKRVYSFHAADPIAATEWCTAIQQRVKLAKESGDDVGPVVAKVSVLEAELPKSPFLLMFAKAMFGKGIHSPISSLEAEEKQKLSKSMKDDFKTEERVLTWLLTNAMHPATGQWTWDVRSDREVEEELKTPRPPGVILPLACSMEGCKFTVISEEKLCVFHMNSRSPKSKSPREHQLHEMFTSQDFIRHLQKVFDSPDANAHGLAIKVLWAFMYGMYDRKEAAKEFDSYVSIICNGPKLNRAIAHSLVYMLLTHPKEFNTEHPTRISFYNPVLNDSLWKPIFGVLYGSEWKIREQAFQDITTVLHDCFDNCQSLERTPNWQTWVFGVLLDIMKKDRNENETIKTCFAFGISTITQVHFEFFIKSKNDEFVQVLLNTLTSLYSFGALTMESGQIAGTLLGALITKLTKTKKIFSFDYKSHEWVNFRQLRDVAKKYVFKTAFWNREFYFASSEKDDDKKETDGLLFEEPPEEVPKKNKKPYESSKFVLTRNRQKNTQGFNDETDIKQYGLHYGEDGMCSDIALCDKMLALFKVLGVDTFDVSLKPSATDDEKASLRKLERHFVFWCDAKRFCESLKLQDIEETRLTTHRRVQHWCKEFLEKQKSPSDRQGVIESIKKNLTKKISSKDSMIGSTSPTSSSRSQVKQDSSSTTPQYPSVSALFQPPPPPPMDSPI